MLRWLRVSAIANVSSAFFFAVAIFSAAACSRTAAQDAVANEPLAETESPPSIVKPAPPPTLAENAPAADGTVSVVVEPVREASPPSPPPRAATQSRLATPWLPVVPRLPLALLAATAWASPPPLVLCSLLLATL